MRQQIEYLLNFLEPLLPFANCHMVDFFTNSCYKNVVPKNIKIEIEKIGYEKATDFIFKNDFAHVPNLSFFVKSSEIFTLKNSDSCIKIDDFIEILKKRNCDVEKFKLEVFMTAKKSHEVEILSSVAAAVSKLAKTSHIVDIGGGKGYLSSFLALYNKIPVLGVDASNINTCGAQKRVNKLSKVWNSLPNAPHKSLPKKNETNISVEKNLYKQITEFVDEDFDLEKLVTDVFELKDSSVRLGLVGLHTCGNLSPNSLRIFTKNDSVKSIINIGCCYHLISEEKNSTFPMSQFLSDKNVSIGRSARMIANQSVERVLEARDLPNITIFYRALLQIILQKFCTELPTKHVGKFRKPPENFLDYVRIALKRVEVDLDISDDQILDIFAEFEHRLHELNVFYLLRCKLSPVIESLILLDRLLFLREKGFENSFLVQFFDPVVSPRCYGIVALKENF